MKTKIITDTEIKKLLGIGGTSQDALVAIWNDIATEMLCNHFEIDNIATHAVIDERAKISDPAVIVVEDFPVDTNETITIKDPLEHAIENVTFSLEPKSRRTLRIKNQDGVPMTIGYEEVLISYTAGYREKDTLEVADITGLADKTINVTIAGTTTVWTMKASGATGNQINIGVDEDACAANIATALGGTASLATVTLPLGTRVELLTATSANFVIISANVPQDIKLAVAMIAGAGFLEKTKKGGSLQSYSIGGKSVTFGSSQEKGTVQMIVDNWASYYKKTRIFSI